MPCGHQWKQINDVLVCIKCGVSRVDKAVIFDRDFPNERKRIKNRKRIKEAKI